jgi:hypothetical protein
MIKIGDTVWVQPWGDAAPVQRVVEYMELCDSVRGKHGKPVTTADLATQADRLVVDFVGNNGWAYGTQIRV